MMHHARSLKIGTYQVQVDKIRDDRLLLQEPDPVLPLTKLVSQFLQKELLEFKQHFTAAYKSVDDQLKTDTNWAKLNPQEQEDLLKKHSLDPESRIEIITSGNEKMLAFLDLHDLKTLKEMLTAISGHLQALLAEVVLMLAPEAQFVELDRPLFQNEEEIDSWIQKVAQKLKNALKKGPVTPI